MKLIGLVDTRVQCLLFLNNDGTLL